MTRAQTHIATPQIAPRRIVPRKKAPAHVAPTHGEQPAAFPRPEGDRPLPGASAPGKALEFSRPRRGRRALHFSSAPLTSRASQAFIALILAAFATLSLSATQPESSETQSPAPAEQATRFLAVDLFLDPHNQPLAAYQIEITSAAGPLTTLVGIEGGDGAYAHAPYYDPEALHPQAPEDPDAAAQPLPPERVILAALASDPAAAPTSDSRIARLHYMLEGPGEPSLSARLIVAGADEHTPINANIRLVPIPIEDP